MTARSSAFYSHFPLGKTSVYAEPAKSVGVVTAFTVGGERAGGAIQKSRGGVLTGIVSAPCRYIHSPFSTCLLSDFDHTWRLLAAFCKAAPQHPILFKPVPGGHGRAGEPCGTEDPASGSSPRQ